MNAAELLAMLRAHYIAPNKQPPGLFAAEITSPDGRRRADAMWMPLVGSAGDELVGHEIKVSRADVLVELQEPAKCDPWLKFCDRWWLVVASGDLLIGLWDQIPSTWGVLAPPSGRRKRTMTVLRPAPALKPIDRTPALQRLLAWSYYRDRDQIHALERRHEHDERTEGLLRNQIAQLRAAGDAEASPLAQRAMELLNTVDRLAATERVWARGDNVDDLVARAVVDRLVVERGTQDLARRLDHVLTAIADPLGYARQSVTEARKFIDPKEDL